MARERPKPLVVTDLASPAGLDGLTLCPADEYLAGKAGTLAEDLLIINLCRSYQYLSQGYYVSLLADARHQQVLPSLDMIEELSNPAVYFRTLRAVGLDTIDFKSLHGRRRLVPKVIVLDTAGGSRGDQFPGPVVSQQAADGQLRYERTVKAYHEVTAVFGKTLEKRFRRQVAAIFKVYALPLLRVRFYEEPDGWKVGQIFPAFLDHLTPPELRLLAEEFSTGKLTTARSRALHPRPHRIACLWDAADPLAPSDEDTLEKFARVAAKRGIVLEKITKNEMLRLAEYDALFIRTVTALDHYSYAFAQTAESLGMPVIDDPQSIVRCSNKVYWHALCQRTHIPTPTTMTVSRKTPQAEIQALGFPLIVKLPDGTFSQAVKKARDRGELDTILHDMFKRSPLLIVQEFIPTAFDWRVGVLENKILYACKYHMARDHWQILKRYQSGFTRAGRVEAIRIDAVPAAVKEVALESAALIGNGLYGVDVKETQTGAVVIEINDNPNIEAGYEDRVEKDRIYEAIIDTLIRRVHEQSRAPQLL